MEEPITLWEVMELITELSFGDKIRLLEALNSEIERELRANRYTPGKPEHSLRKSKGADSGDEPSYETQHDAWRTFTYYDMN